MSLDATRLPVRSAPRPPLVVQRGQIRIATVTDAERARAFARARRHSALVRVLKMTLPVLAVCAVGVLFITPRLIGSAVSTAVPGAGVDAVEVTGDQLRMVNPRFEGETAEKGRYVVTAKAAVQTTGNLDQMLLEGVHGHIVEADKSWTDITANGGVYETKKRSMTLNKGIVITSSANARAELETADVDIDKKRVTSAVPVVLTLPNGTLKGKGLLIEGDARRFVLPADVVAHLIPPKSGVMKPKAVAGAGAFSAAPAMTDGPIDVTARRLEVLDDAKTANFTGAVEARQAGMTLTAVQLEIGYTGGGSANPLAPATAGGSAQNIRTATALKNVVITTTDGRKATADKSVFDQQANSMTLLGAVILSQAGNVLHADKVVADLTARRTHVTAANRVIGHFVPAAKPDSASAMAAPVGLAALGSSGSATDISANSLDLADDTGEAVFQGTVMVSQRGNHLTGERLSVDTNQRRMTMSGPGRVTGTFEGTVANTKTAKAANSDQGFKTVSTGVGGHFTDLSADSGQPTNIEADSLTVEDEKGQATFTGKVVVVRGENRISAGTLNVYYAGGAAGSALQRITAKDHVVIRAPDNQTASGDNLLYEPSKNQLLLTGNVTVSQGGNIVNGQRLVVDLDSGESHFVTAAPPEGELQVPGAPKPGRISVMITPEGIKKIGGPGTEPAPAKTKKPKTGLIGSDVWVAPN